MAGHCIEKLSHSCGTSDALQVFEEDGNYTGYCFACSTYVPNPYENGKPSKKARVIKTPEEIQQELEFISTLPSVDLPDRKLRKETLDHFGVKVGLSRQDGATPALIYYPLYKDAELKAFGTKLIDPKKFWFVGDTTDVELFGWQQALASGAKRLFITEGGNDAMALYQALKDKERGTKWEHLQPAVVSLNFGAGGARRELSRCVSLIKSTFKEVVLVFDQDKAGKAATQEALHVIPIARTVNLPDKDANACLINGRATALCNAVLFNAATPKNTRLVLASTLYEAAREAPTYGLSWPWEGLTRMTRGIRFGETYYLGAGVKMGKSEMVNTLAAHLITEHKLKVLMAKPEEANKKSVKLVMGKVAGKIFHDPEIPFDYEAYDAATKIVGDDLYLINLYQHLGWESLRPDIIEAAENGCKAVFIDPITNLYNGQQAGEAKSFLQDVAQDLSAMSKDLDIVSFIFCHLKAPEGGPSHERGGKVYSHQFAGSRAMMRSCNLMLGLEGNKDPDFPEEQRNLRNLVLLEDREFGAVGNVHLYWDKNTGLFTEIKED